MTVVINYQEINKLKQKLIYLLNFNLKISTFNQT